MTLNGGKMDLFDMLSEKEPVVNKDIANEIKELSKKHNVKIPDALAIELASIWNDPPPWSPWA